MTAQRSRFGALRQLASGRWQASYIGPDGLRRLAPQTFARKTDAKIWLSEIEADLRRGTWYDPEAQRVTLSVYGWRWIAERPGLRPRTVDVYRSLFRRHIEPGLGDHGIGQIEPATIRGWRLALVQAGVSPTMIAKSYRLLRAVLMTAVDDGVLARNPCRIKAGGAESAAERPVLTVDQVLDLSTRVPLRYAVLVLVAAFGSLRWGEAVALRRRDIDLTAQVVHVRSAVVELSSGKLLRGKPKSRAGVRSVALPGPIVTQLREHLGAFADTGPDALAFPGPSGQLLRRSNFNRQATWPVAVAAVGAPGLHFHDLRHTGNTLAAQTGASLRDLMTRMGHDSMQAALIYQHRTRGADQKIAEGLAALLPPHAVAHGLHDDPAAGPVQPDGGEAEAV